MNERLRQAASEILQDPVQQAWRRRADWRAGRLDRYRGTAREMADLEILADWACDLLTSQQAALQARLQAPAHEPRDRDHQ